MESLTQKKKRAQEIITILAKKYPEPKTALHFSNTFELLIATILSAQTTDVRVNLVTPQLFPQYNHPAKLLALGEEKLKGFIKSINLFPTKAKNIIKLCEILMQHYQGTVPPDRTALESLPGVGRKTASVILANAFNIPAIAVDTHVFRVSTRLGLSASKNTLTVEKDLMKVVPEHQWIYTHHYLIFHGREICTARAPKCFSCPISHICPFQPKTELPKK